MSATELLEQLNAMPEAERSSVFAYLIANEEWRQDILDLITISERRDEPTRPIDDVFRDLQLDALPRPFLRKTRTTRLRD